LGEAYGVCVILVTFITTSMVSLVAVMIWHLPPVIVAFGFLVFGALDGLYLSSALTKIPDGAWFTLALAVLLSSIFILWRYGKENQWRAEANHRLPLRRLFASNVMDDTSRSSTNDNDRMNIRLAVDLGSASISPIKGMGIFFDKTGNQSDTPMVFIQFMQKFQATPAVAVFFHIRPLSRPTVNPEERFSVSRCFDDYNIPDPIRNIFRITLRHGYTDEVVTPDLGMLLYEQLRNFIIREASPRVHFRPIELRQRQENERIVRQRLDSIKIAYEDQVVYVVGKEQLRIREHRNAKNLARRTAMAAFLWLRGNTGSKVANLNIDVEKLVELGFVNVV